MRGLGRKEREGSTAGEREGGDLLEDRYGDISSNSNSVGGTKVTSNRYRHR